MVLIAKTVLDKDGNLHSKGNTILKNFSINTLNSNPLTWSNIVRKDTNNLDINFVKPFLKGAGLEIQNLLKIADWFPYYYVTYLMELSNVLNSIGIVSFKGLFKNNLEFFNTSLGIELDSKTIDIIPNNIDDNTKIGELSDIFFPFVNLNYPLFLYN